MRQTYFMLRELEEEWHRFVEDPPGQRFQHHLERAKRSGRAARGAQLALGVALLAGGVVLLFIPGPGLLVMLFGAALLAGFSRRLAALLDRAEPRLRARVARGRDWWRAASLAARIAIVALGFAIAGGAAALMLFWLLR
jgi:putative transmembrane protein PGPGW